MRSRGYDTASSEQNYSYMVDLSDSASSDRTVRRLKEQLECWVCPVEIYWSLGKHSAVGVGDSHWLCAQLQPLCPAVFGITLDTVITCSEAVSGVESMTLCIWIRKLCFIVKPHLNKQSRAAEKEKMGYRWGNTVASILGQTAPTHQLTVLARSLSVLDVRAITDEWVAAIIATTKEQLHQWLKPCLITATVFLNKSYRLTSSVIFHLLSSSGVCWLTVCF